MKKILRLICIVGAASLVILAVVILRPRQYDVPSLKVRKGVSYWDLSTGSRIGYTFLKGKGEARSTPVIYLHGGPGGPVYQKNIEALSPLTDAGFDVYLYDQVGCGQSCRLEDISQYTVERHISDLDAIIKKIGAEKVILIGQSWGAILATLFIAEHPGKVDQLILTGPGPIFPVREELANVQPPDSLKLREPQKTNRQANEKVQNLRSLASLRFALIFDKKLMPDEEADNFATLLNNELNKGTVCDTLNALDAEPGGGFYVQAMTLQSLNSVPDPRAKLRGSQMPVLILKGQCDNQSWGFTSEYLELFPNHKLKVIPNAGHSIATEQPEQYIRSIREFLEK